MFLHTWVIFESKITFISSRLECLFTPQLKALRVAFPPVNLKNLNNMTESSAKVQHPGRIFVREFFGPDENPARMLCARKLELNLRQIWKTF